MSRVPMRCTTVLTRTEIRKNEMPTPTATAATVRTTRSSSRPSGVTPVVPSWVRAAIEAMRVEPPVAATTPRPSPLTTNAGFRS